VGALYRHAVDLVAGDPRMVSNMYTLQHSLQWQAWHDPLTR
jgi:hypothetical protein